MPAGTKFLVGTSRRARWCEKASSTAARSRPFKSEIDGSLKGTVEPTVDATKHVNGGCRSLSADGREWTVLRRARRPSASRSSAPGFLGEYAPSPGVG